MGAFCTPVDFGGTFDALHLLVFHEKLLSSLLWCLLVQGGSCPPSRW